MGDTILTNPIPNEKSHPGTLKELEDTLREIQEFKSHSYSFANTIEQRHPRTLSSASALSSGSDGIDVYDDLTEQSGVAVSSNADNVLEKALPLPHDYDHDAIGDKGKEDNDKSMDEKGDIIKVEQFEHALFEGDESHPDLALVASHLTKIQETQNNVLMALRNDIEELTITNMILKQQNVDLTLENKELLKKVEDLFNESQKLREKIITLSKGNSKLKYGTQPRSIFYLHSQKYSDNVSAVAATPAAAGDEESQNDSESSGQALHDNNSSNNTDHTEELQNGGEQCRIQQPLDTGLIHRYSDELHLNRIQTTPQAIKFTSYVNNSFGDDSNRGTSSPRNKTLGTTTKSTIGRFFKLFRRRRQGSYTIPQQNNNTCCDPTNQNVTW